MKIFNRRYGFATNSSSTHSVVSVLTLNEIKSVQRRCYENESYVARGEYISTCPMCEGTDDGGKSLRELGIREYSSFTGKWETELLEDGETAEVECGNGNDSCGKTFFVTKIEINDFPVYVVSQRIPAMKWAREAAENYYQRITKPVEVNVDGATHEHCEDCRHCMKSERNEDDRICDGFGEMPLERDYSCGYQGDWNLEIHRDRYNRLRECKEKFPIPAPEPVKRKKVTKSDKF